MFMVIGVEGPMECRSPLSVLIDTFAAGVGEPLEFFGRRLEEMIRQGADVPALLADRLK